MTSEIESILGEVALPSARGGRKPTQLAELEVVRALVPDDLADLAKPLPAEAKPAPTAITIRHSHHMLAQALARGDTQEHVSLITGYSPAYISTLKGDPAFAELLAYYGQQQELAFADVTERMRALGITALDELRSRLESAPDDWTRREIMELIELTLVKPGRQLGAPGASGPGHGVSIEVKFVEARSMTKIIDVTPNDGG